MSHFKEDQGQGERLPVRRWGGNSTSRYHWQNDTTNTSITLLVVPPVPGPAPRVGPPRRHLRAGAP